MEQNVLEQILEGSMKPTDLPLETLREITNNFSTDRVIGGGGFGTVYKGVLRNGNNVAVKRIMSNMTINEKPFRREVGSLMEVNHQNVVRFLGFCSHTVETPVKNPEAQGYIFAEKRERLLCFEYISNGSLDNYITDELRGLDWDTRFQIIKGISMGLCYLHMEKRILHMDLKPANVLLDNQMVPKITDFGLSRSEENSQTTSTNHFCTPGYAAPENMFLGGRMSVKSDIYSLGAIIIELVTGHKGVPYNSNNVLRRWRHRWKKSAIEMQLAYQQVTKCLEIGLLCQAFESNKRPFISEIVSEIGEMESMNNYIKNADEPIVAQIHPPYWEDDMLGIEPLDLRFAEHNNKHILSCSVELSNDTGGFIAFEIRTASPLPYSIVPNNGIVGPQSKFIVDITRPTATQDNDMAALQYSTKQYTENFIVRSIKVDEGLTTKDINEDIFDTGMFDEVHLTVVSDNQLEAPCVPEEPKEVQQVPYWVRDHRGVEEEQERMYALISSTQWVVGKALAPFTDGLLETWGATKNLVLNIEALRMELLLVKATLETTSRKQIAGQAMEELLWMLRCSAHRAEDLLDELDYFRIHDELHGTYDAADHHAKGCVHDLALNARHVTKASVGLSASSSAASPSAGDSGQVEDARHQVSCNAWPCARQRSRGNSSSVPKRETLMLGFNRVDVSKRMKSIVQQLQPVRTEVTKILQSCDRIIVPDIVRSLPITTSQSIEPKLYGRDRIINTIIHDMTKGKYSSKDLTVLPIVGPGGIGKTTLIQHLYHNKEVQNHFQAVIWVCVSLSFNKLLEDIKTYIPRVEGEKDGRAEELIERRLKSKRFLLVLDNMWEFSSGDDWKRLLLPFKASQEKGSMILLTTRFPAVAKMVKTTDYIELKGLKSEEFRKLFLAFAFGDEPFRSDHNFLLETGDKIMEKLKGSPLAAKFIGTLLRNDLNLRHWRRILESKQWETETDANDIMPALKLSYYYLPFHQQQCLYYSALFPENHKYSATELINLWIGLDILQPGGWNQTLEDIGLSNLNDLVTHGIFREEETDGHLHYVMHDLLHDLALQVASHECISLHRSNMGLVEIQPSIRHLSIIIDDVGADNEVSSENFMSELRKLKTRLKVEHLQTLMLFGGIDESFAKILGDLFKEASALRVLRLVNMPSSVESMLHNFPSIVHLRYLCLGTNKCGKKMQLPPTISIFYHLVILDLGSWYCYCDLPRDLSNLAKLRHFYTPSDELHSHIYNVGKLRLLEELKVFRVNKESEGFEPKQLEHLTELRELGIYNLENIHTKEEADKAKLMEKSYLERLTLDWDSMRSNTEPGVEEAVLESLQPHRYLQELCIRGHGGSSCPTWLGDELAVEVLQSVHLSGVSWEHLPPLGKMWGLRKLVLEHIATVKEFVIEQSFRMLIRLELVGLGSFKKWVPSQDTHHKFPLLQALIIRDCPKLLELPFSSHIVHPKPDQNWNIDWFPKLQELEIMNCSELLLVAQIPWTRTLCHVKMRGVRLLVKFEYDRNSYYGVSLDIVGKSDLQSLDQVVDFNKLTGLKCLDLRKCPPLEWKRLLMLTSLKKLIVASLDGLVGPSPGGGADVEVEWQHPVVKELIVAPESVGGPSGKELTELLTHIPSLSRLCIINCKNITQVAVGVNLQQTKAEVVQVKEEEEEEEEDGLLLFPSHLSDSLRDLKIQDCPELVLVDPLSAFLPAQGGGGGFQALQSLQELRIWRCPKIFSAKSLFSSPSCCLFPSSLTVLYLWWCGEDLRCKGLEPLLTTGGQLRVLNTGGSPGFFAGWDPNPTQVLLLQDGGGEEQEQQQLVAPLSSSKLQELETADAMGLLAMPICSLLSSSLTRLELYGTYYREMERFTREQEDALLLLASLQELNFREFNKLQSLPATLHKLTNLKELVVYRCPAVRSLPKDGLPKSLQELDVSSCKNEELKQQCGGLVGTIPELDLSRGD